MNTAIRELSADSAPVKFSQFDIDRFWSKVNKEGPLPDQSNPHYKGLARCHQWTAGCNSGYGNLKFAGSPKLAHRVSWMLHRGEIPVGLCVMHRCDNPLCVNPCHLMLGTKGDNNRDREAKGRGAQPSGDRNGMRTMPESTLRGEKNGQSKLTEESVRAIRAIYAGGGIFQKDLAKVFGVSQSLVDAIVRRVAWKHVQ